MVRSLVATSIILEANIMIGKCLSILILGIWVMVGIPAHAVYDEFKLNSMPSLPDVAQQAAAATVTVFKGPGISKRQDGSYSIEMVRLSETPNTKTSVRRFCKDEKYAESQRGRSALSTGVLISPNHILLAGHSVDKKSDCRKHKYVFGFTAAKSVVPSSSVYSCRRVRNIRWDSREKFRPSNYGDNANDGSYDYAIVELDRPVEGVKPVCVRSSQNFESGKDLYLISSLRGMPLTWQSVQVQRHVSGTVSTNASTGQGASGAPYIDPMDGCLVGIHTSFAADKDEQYTGLNYTLDSKQQCLRWVYRESKNFPFNETTPSQARGTLRPKGSLMTPIYNMHEHIAAARREGGLKPTNLGN